MCGIAGYLAQGSNNGVLEDVLRRMCGTLTHRGPDDYGEFIEERIALGHRRLSIIDLSKGHQPIKNEDESLVIIFNGEIYNFQVLREELLAKGHRFRTRTDTEVIIHLYEEYGEDCVHRLRGMFAFAIWDRKNQHLFLARDRMGVKPLYYASFGGYFLFASEIKAILEHPACPRDLDPEAFENFLTFRYVPGPRTMFEGIRKLPPGHTLHVDRNGSRLNAYWDLSYEVRPIREEEAAEVLLSRLEESVRLRLISEVPLGAFLSGGVDSSAIVALMSRLASGSVNTFSVGYGEGDQDFSELEYARKVASLLGTRHHELMLGDRDMVGTLPDLIWHFDEPVSDPAAIPTLLVSRLAGRHVKVVLTGEGSDELFAGYPKYAIDPYSALASRVPSAVSQMALSALGRLRPAIKAKVTRFGRVLRIADEATRWPEWFGIFDAETKRAILREQKFPDGPRLLVREVLGDSSRDSLNQMLYLDLKTWLVDDLLMKGDKMTMAASIEGRVPFLDHPLVEWAATLPPALKVKGKTGKYILKRALSGILPNEILHRKKVGFAVPLERWFRTELRELLRDGLLSENSGGGLFNRVIVARLVEEHLEGRADHHRELWALLTFEMWRRRFLPTGISSGTAS